MAAFVGIVGTPSTAVRSSSVRSADVGCICSCEKPQMEDEKVYLLADALVVIIQKLRFSARVLNIRN